MTSTAATSVYLHSPVELPCGLVLGNRLAKAALTECLAHPVTHAPNALHTSLYSNWKQLSGAGMLITGNIQIDGRYKEAPGNVAIEDSSHLDALCEWARSAQSETTKLIAQISHAGRQCPISVTNEPIAPSAVPAVKMQLPLFAKPRAMTSDEIGNVIRRFTDSARVLQQAGFSGVEIHAAHGYLLSQFLSPITNLRNDQFGGSLDNRKRLLFEILRSVRTAVGPKFAVGVKLNSADFQKGGFTEDESTIVIEGLLADKVIALDFLEISGGCYEHSVMMTGPTSRAREVFFMDFAEKVRKLVSNSNEKKSKRVVFMLTGGFRSATTMLEALQAGIVDIVGMGRPFIMQPSKVKELLELSEKYQEGDTIAIAKFREFQFKDAVLKTGVKDFDAGLQNLWHQTQMRLIAEGKTPDYQMTFFWALTTRTFSTYVMDWRSGSTKSKMNLIVVLVVLSILPSLSLRFLGFI